MPYKPLAALIFALAMLCHAVAQTPRFDRNVSVHDPSVIKVGDRFYVFGSHGASAWSEDLMNWTQVATGVNAGSPPHFQSFASELSEMIEWTSATTLWAADVYQMEDGKFYYYYNVWNNPNDLYRSYMGLAIADDIEGPYIDQGELLRGGGTGFNANIHPNTIDPTLYRDTEDKLWMVYGSYSGGIFVLEMDDQTGFQKEGQSWGTRLLGGSHQLIEGPFIEYNADTEYYYLFLSYGGLVAADGYNMRVFRSENPGGPFFDPAGNNMSTASGPFANYGLKLAGNWQFTPVEGEPATSTTGYLSPGHNSVIRDPATGKWFNIFHTRFAGRGEQHEVRVHQMFFNEDGWPVMAPHRYAGETQGSFTAAEVAGSYKVVNHGKDITGALKTSSVIGLQQGGGLVGAEGSWLMVDGRNIHITLDGNLYKGVLCEQWDDENKLWVNGFTAASDAGVSIWGSQVAARDRDGDLEGPVLAAIEDRILEAGETLSFTLTNTNPDSELVLQYKVIEGPEGLQINAGSGVGIWTPFASQRGEVYRIRIQAYDLLDPELADEVTFWVYATGGFEREERTINFSESTSGGILDTSGVATGLSARLSGTGASLPTNDPNLALDRENGVLLLDSTQADFNGQAGVQSTSAVGMKLSELSFSGEQDFTVIASFGPIVGLGDVDQVGVFVGTSATTLTRAGIFQAATGPQGLAVHTQSGNDQGATFDTSEYDVSEGLTVAISREAGVWSYLVNGVPIAPASPNASFLDAAQDLTVGVFAINPLNANSKTVEVESLKVSVLSDHPKVPRIQEWRTGHFGTNPEDGVAGNEDDPDGDGRKNLIEYAFGSDPLSADADTHSEIWVSGGKLFWQFTRIDDPTLIYSVMRNEAPVESGSEEIWRSAFGDNLQGAALVETEIGSGAGGHVFLSLKVELAE